MELNIMERLMLLNNLPQEGSLVTMRVLATLRERLGLTDDEITTCGVVHAQTGQVTWDDTKEVPTDIQIGATAREIVASTLKKLDEENKVIPSLLSLYDKFEIGED